MQAGAGRRRAKRTGRANYILGTAGDDNFTGQLTAGNDVICGFAGNDLAFPEGGLPAGDVFLGGDGNDTVGVVHGGTFNGGDGNDTVSVVSGGAFNGGDGNDRVIGILSGGTFNGEAGCDFAPSPTTGGTFNPGDQSTCP